MKFQRPSPLKPDDRVAILSPSAGLPHVFPHVYEQGLKRLKEVFQLEPVEYPTTRASPDYLAAHPEERARDLMAAFIDPAIKGIIATIGGNDQIRILPYLDKKMIAAHPKPFMGYSDCTNLHLFLWNLGIVSYYGGAIMTQFALGGGMQEYTIQSIKKALFTPSTVQVEAALQYSDADLDWADPENLNRLRPQYSSKGWIWHNSPPKPLTGQLWGGCLEVLALHLAANRYLPDPDRLNNCILFVETSEEMPSEGFVNRFFAALGERGLLHKFQAILVGIPKAQFCGTYPPEGREAFITNQRAAVLSALKDYHSDIPVIFHLNFGHTDPQLILPSGGQVTIDGLRKTITFC